MNNSKLQQILTEKGAKEFKQLLDRNEVLTNYLDEIFQHYISEFSKPATQKDLTNPSWPLVRAYRDGGRYYLETLHELFKEKK